MDGPTHHQVRDNLLWLAADFRAIIESANAHELDLPSAGTRWTNRQLLFHLVLGQNVALSGIPLCGLFSRLPPSVARNWSRLLDACAGPYNWVNWVGSAAAGRVLKPQAMVRMMDRTTGTIVGWYDRTDGEALRRGMTIPASWDPYFTSWMDRRDIFEWAPKHYRHHRAQLTLTTLPS